MNFRVSVPPFLWFIASFSWTDWKRILGAMFPAPYTFFDGGCSAQACLWLMRVLAVRGWVKPVRTPVAILGPLGVCIYVPATRHWLISYSPIHLN